MTAVPALMALTLPMVSMVATEGVPLLHVPPVVMSVSKVVSPAQRDEVPEMELTLGVVEMVILWVAMAVPQLLVTV